MSKRSVTRGAGDGAPHIEAPRLPAKLQRLVLTAGGFADRDTYTEGLLADSVLSGHTASYVALAAMRLQQVKLDGTHFKAIQINDMRLESCDLSNADWERADLNRVELVSCRLTGFTAAEARMHDLVVEECDGKLLQLRFATFKLARFDRCNLREADFYGADLSGVVFTGCDLSNAEMSTAKLAGAVLCGSNIEGIKAGVQELQGAVVDPMQAVQLAGQLGLHVRWDETSIG